VAACTLTLSWIYPARAKNISECLNINVPNTRMRISSKASNVARILRNELKQRPRKTLPLKEQSLLAFLCVQLFIVFVVGCCAASRQTRLLAKKRKSKPLYNELSYRAHTRFISRGKEDTMRAQCSESIPCTFGRQTIITESSVPRTMLRENTDAISGTAPASQLTPTEGWVALLFPRETANDVSQYGGVPFASLSKPYLVRFCVCVCSFYIIKFLTYWKGWRTRL